MIGRSHPPAQGRGYSRSPNKKTSRRGFTRENMRKISLVILLCACSKPRDLPTPINMPDAGPTDALESSAPVPVEVPPPPDPTKLLGAYSTDYEVGGKMKTRAANIALAATKLSVEIGAGEVFSFNDTVGPRDESDGFSKAPVILQGIMVEDIGGGVCQVASTVHAAALHSKLQIVERRPHSRISKYIAPGLDATVVYPSDCKTDPKCDRVNLKIRNPYGRSVGLKVMTFTGTRKGKVEAQFYGFESTVEVKYGYSKKEVEDAEAPKQVFFRSKEYRSATYKKKVQEGQLSYLVRSSLTYTEAGKEPVKIFWLSKYPTVDEAWEIGKEYDVDAGLPWAPVDAGITDADILDGPSVY